MILGKTKQRSTVCHQINTRHRGAQVMICQVIQYTNMENVSLLYIPSAQLNIRRGLRGRAFMSSDLQSLSPLPLQVRTPDGEKTLQVRKPSSWLAVGRWFYLGASVHSGSSSTCNKLDVAIWLKYCRRDGKPKKTNKPGGQFVLDIIIIWTTVKGGQRPRNIPPKFYQNWPSG